jgi:hypothetical protein
VYYEQLEIIRAVLSKYTPYSVMAL